MAGEVGMRKFIDTIYTKQIVFGNKIASTAEAMMRIEKMKGIGE